MKILLVEGNPDDTALAKEAILEIDESRRWRNWVRQIDLVHIERLEDAVAVLAEERFDVALVSTALPDSSGLAPLLTLRTQAPDVPVILLVSDEDDALAVSAIREGAEDCVSKRELDCALLARSLRNAVERRRRTTALRCTVLLDAETGLYNYNGYLAAAGRDRKLARKWNRTVSLVVAALDRNDCRLEAAQTAPLELAEILGLSFPDTALFARLNAHRFAVLSLCADEAEARARHSSLVDRVFLRNLQRRANELLTVRVGSAWAGPSEDIPVDVLLELAQASLCENGRSEPVALNHARRASA